MNNNKINNRENREDKSILKSYYEAKDKKKVILNMQESDKKKLVALDNWALKAFEYSILERNLSVVPKRGEIWTFDLGINVGDEMDKVRPCIIISYNKYNDKSNLVTVIPITHADLNHRTQFKVDETVLEYIETSLCGTAKAEQITTKSQARLGRKIGKLNNEGLVLTIKAILNHLGLDFLAQMIDTLSDELLDNLLDSACSALQCKNELEASMKEVIVPQEDTYTNTDADVIDNIATDVSNNNSKTDEGTNSSSKKKKKKKKSSTAKKKKKKKRK